MKLLIAYLVLMFSGAFAAASSDTALSSLDLDSALKRVRENRLLCGPLALWSCLQLRDRDAPLQPILDQVTVGERGVPLSEILQLAKKYEPDARAVYYKDKDLTILPIPSILVINGTHCVSLAGLDDAGSAAYVIDASSREAAWAPVSLLNDKWTGEAITFGKTGRSRLQFLSLNLACSLIICLAAGGLLRLPPKVARAVASADTAPPLSSRAS
jgi:hypothetical protein